MKKSLLVCGAVLLSAMAQESKAQLALENFNTGSLPANWVMINDGNTVHSSAFNGIGALITLLNANAWAPYQVIPSTLGYSMITTSYFNPADSADRWLITPSFNVPSANTVLTWQDYDLGSGEMMEVLISPTAGTTASSFIPVYRKPAGNNSSTLVTHAISLGAYNGQSVRVAFREHDYDNWGMILDNVQTSTIANLVEATVASVTPAPGTAFVYASTGQPTTISGTIRNNGAQALSSVTVHYQQGANPVVSETFTPTYPIQPNSTEAFTFSTPFTSATTGNFPIKVWVALTGDANTANDTATTTIVVADSLQTRISLFEEFTGASCNPCAAQNPHIDSVVANNFHRMNAIRYHVPIPARDLIYTATRASVDPRTSFYGINSAPSSRINGIDQYPGAGFFGSFTVDRESAAKSPFKLGLSATHDASTDTYTVNGDIKSFASFPAGLRAYAALTIDTITYTTNISLASIPQSVFPQSVVHIFPSGSGTALSAFTPGSSQTFASTWVKDHRWGDVAGGSFAYDSTKTGAVTFWVQDPNTKTVYQSIAIPISTVSSLSVGEIIANNAVSIYPNPAKGAAMLDFSLLKSGRVVVSVMDAAGRTAAVVADAQMAQGEQHISIPTSALAAGMYNVVIRTDNGTLTQRLSVVK